MPSHEEAAFLLTDGESVYELPGSFARAWLGRGPDLAGIPNAVVLIAVIQNGMSLTGVESYTQRVVLGAIIIGAVLLDRRKRPPR